MAVLCSIFTKADISEEDLASTTFSMTFVARGYKGEPPVPARARFKLVISRTAGLHSLTR